MTSESPEETKGNQPHESNNDSATHLTKRSVLKQAGAVAAGVTGLAGVSTSSEASTWPYCIRGSPIPDGGSWNKMDIRVVDMTSSSSSAAQNVKDGFCDGIDKLYDRCSWFEGYRIKFEDTDVVFTRDDSVKKREDLKNALDQAGLTKDKHYHIVYDGQLFPILDRVDSYHWTDDSAWGQSGFDREISGLSLATTNAPFCDTGPYIRGLHQALHNYIEDKHAHTLTNDSFSDAYKAKHALGAHTDNWDRDQNGYIRTIMVDLSNRATLANKECKDFNADLSQSAPPDDNIYFSDCTVKALKMSAFSELRR